MSKRRQIDVLRDVMESARQCEMWLTRQELHKLTQYPLSSVAAYLAKLSVKKRHRLGGAGEWEHLMRAAKC